MKRLLFIARFEFIRQISRRRYLFLMFGMPLLMVLLIGGSGLIMALVLLVDTTEQAVGYVDQAGIIPPEQDISLDTTTSSFDAVALYPYPTESKANEAFITGRIDAYVVIPPDYLERGVVTAYGYTSLSFESETSVKRLLRRSLLANEAEQAARRATFPMARLRHRLLKPEPTPSAEVAGHSDMPHTVTRVQPNNEDTRQQAWFFPLVLMFGMMFWGTVFGSSSYLLQALVDEKENRTMEIVITSVTPEQLIGGKTLGLGVLGLTQLMVWLSYGLGPMALLAPFFEPLREGMTAITTSILPVATLFFVPSYFIYAGVIVAIGAMVTSVQEGQQLSSLLMLPAMAPIFLIGLIQANPNGPLAIALSLFPITAPLTLMMRMSLSEVPLWQSALSLAILLLSVVLVIGGAARLFRAGMLNYGKRIRVRDVLRRVARAVVRRPRSNP
jgi:ABC-2 type transport system permease protein